MAAVLNSETWMRGKKNACGCDEKLPGSSSRVIGLGALSGCEITESEHGGDPREEGHECQSRGWCLSSACKSQDGPLGIKETPLIRVGNQTGHTHMSSSARSGLLLVSASIGINKCCCAGRAPGRHSRAGGASLSSTCPIPAPFSRQALVKARGYSGVLITTSASQEFSSSAQKNPARSHQRFHIKYSRRIPPRATQEEGGGKKKKTSKLFSCFNKGAKKVKKEKGRREGGERLRVPPGAANASPAQPRF